MKEIRLLFMLIIALMAITGCKEDDSPIPATAEDARLLTFGFYMEDNTNLTSDYVVQIPTFVSGINTYEISISMPDNVDKSKLIARFSVNNGNTVSVDGTAQTSQVTKNNFDYPVDYTISNSNKSLNIRYTINVVELTKKIWTEVITLDAAALSGVEGFTGVYTDAKLVVNPKDKVPYVAYGARGVNNKMSVAKFEDGAWKQVGSALFSPIVNGSHYDFDIAPDGTPYVAFGDQDATSVLKGSLSVMKFDGSVWSHVGDQGFFKAQSQYVGIAALDNGLAACLQNNSASGAIARRAMGVATWDGSAWTTGESALLSAGQQMYTCKMGDNGKIATLISINRGAVDGVNYGHNIFKYENGTWESLATNFLESGATQTSIAIGSFGTTVAPDGTVYAWTGDDAPNTTKIYQIRLKKYDSTSKTWNTVGGNTLPLGTDEGIDSHISLDVAIDHKGTPFVAFNNYKDQKKLYVMYLDPNTNQWTTPQLLATGAADINIGFASDGIGYITYTDESNKIHLLKYDYDTSDDNETINSNGKVSTQKILKK